MQDAVVPQYVYLDPLGTNRGHTHPRRSVAKQDAVVPPVSVPVAPRGPNRRLHMKMDVELSPVRVPLEHGPSRRHIIPAVALLSRMWW